MYFISFYFTLIFNLLTSVSFFLVIYFLYFITNFLSFFLINSTYFGYSDPAMLLFSSLLEFHNDVMFFLCQIILLVLFILFYTFFYINRFNKFVFLNAHFSLYIFSALVVFIFYSFFLSNFFINNFEQPFIFYDFGLVPFSFFVLLFYFGGVGLVFFGDYFFNAESEFEPFFFCSFESFLLGFFYAFSIQNFGFVSDNSPVKTFFVYQTKRPVVFELVLETLWTVFPSLILLVISVSSFTILYGLDDQTVMNDASYDNFYLKAIGRQWYWSYEIESTPVVDALATEAGFWPALYFYNQELVGLKRAINVLWPSLIMLNQNTHDLYRSCIASIEEFGAVLLLQGLGSTAENNLVSPLVLQVQSSVDAALNVSEERINSIINEIEAETRLDSNSRPSAISHRFLVLSTLLPRYEAIVVHLNSLLDAVHILTKSSNSEVASTAFDSYMVASDDFLVVLGETVESIVFDTVNHFRLLETDTIIQIPLYTLVRLFVTSTDVLHSWTVPSFGLKIDACPGRLNQGWLFLDREGVFYGQCSELCGLNHGFMPIVVSVNSL